MVSIWIKDMEENICVQELGIFHHCCYFKILFCSLLPIINPVHNIFIVMPFAVYSDCFLSKKIFLKVVNQLILIKVYQYIMRKALHVEKLFNIMHKPHTTYITDKNESSKTTVEK